eukprot:9069241-Lingulodinium_polyedra.AAC.1
MLDAAREVVRHRGLQIKDPEVQKTTMKAVSRQAEELAKESSAKAGDLGRAGVFAHDHTAGGDNAWSSTPYSSRGADRMIYMEFGIEGDAKFCDPDRDRGVPYQTPESAKLTGCREVYQDHAD